MTFPNLSPRADGLPVVLEEVDPAELIGFSTGTQSFSLARIELGERDRPEPPVVGGKQRVTRTVYPGTNRVSVQFHGVDENQIRLRGWFNDPLNPGDPVERMGVVTAMRERGNVIRLTWGDVISKLGRIEEATFTVHQRARIQYDITFAVDAALELSSPTFDGSSTLEQMKAQLREAREIATLIVRTARLSNVILNAAMVL